MDFFQNSIVTIASISSRGDYSTPGQRLLKDGKAFLCTVIEPPAAVTRIEMVFKKAFSRALPEDHPH